MPREGRRRRLPRLELRPRRAPRRAPGRRRGRAAVARGHGPARRRRGRSCPAASPTATTCAPARSRASARSWAPSASTPRAAACVLGICNGFQVLTEAGLLPGALRRNATLRFEHRWVRLSVERRDTPFTRAVPDGRDAAHADRPRRGLLLAARRRPRRARGGRAGCSSATRRRRAIRTARARHRRRHRRARPRVRADAASRARVARRCSARTTACCCIRSLVESAGARGRRPPRDRSARPTGRSNPRTRSASPARPDRRRARRRSTSASAATRTTSSWPCSASCGASTARTRARARCCATLPTSGDGRARRTGRERRRGAHRRWAGGRVQARVAQPSERGRAVPGRRDRASAASCATSSRWARGRSRCSTRSSSAGPTTTRRATWCAASSAASAATATASACPTVGGELIFDPTLHRQPAGQRDVRRAPARGPDRSRRRADARLRWPCSSARRPGATASAAPRCSPARTFDEGSAAMRPSVQIGDPFAGKLLIEASLELVERGLVEGLQDLGAAGLTCATSEMADRGGTGMRIDLGAVPRREDGHGAVRGDDQRVAGADARRRRVRSGSTRCSRCAGAGTCPPRSSARSPTTATSSSSTAARELARIPARALTSDVRSRSRTWRRRPQRRRAAPAPGETPLPHDGLPERGMDPGAVLEALLGHPNLGSRAWVTTQYDQTVGTDTVEGCDRAAAVLRIKGTTQGAGHRDRLAAGRRRCTTRRSARRWRSPSARATSPSPARGRSA